MVLWGRSRYEIACMAFPRKINRQVQAIRDQLFTTASLFALLIDCDNRNLYSPIGIPR